MLRNNRTGTKPKDELARELLLFKYSSLIHKSNLGLVQQVIMQMLLFEVPGIAYLPAITTSSWLGGRPKRTIEQALKRLVLRNILILREDGAYMVNLNEQTWN